MTVERKTTRRKPVTRKVDEDRGAIVTAQITSPAGIAQWPYLDKPAPPFKKRDLPKFKITLKFDDDVAFKKFKAKVDELYEQVVEKYEEVGDCPLKDGDVTGKDSLMGFWYVNASTGEEYPPTVVDAKRRRISPKNVRFGDLVRAVLTFKEVDAGGTGYLACYLQVVQLLEKRDPALAMLDDWESDDAYDSDEVNKDAEEEDDEDDDDVPF